LREHVSWRTTAIAKSFLALLGLPTVTVEGAPAVHLAIHMLERGIDFADALHLASSANAERFVTFDAKLVKRARKVAPLPGALA
jgi:predicted nucleic acid-binding protein